MLVGRIASYYRPYYVIASGREYKVENIHFYQDGKIIVSSNCGWLGNSKGKDIENLEIPVNKIKVKRKENFNGEVFAISKGKESYGTDLVAELYIPAEIFDIHFVENIIRYKTQVRAIYKGTNDIYIETYIKSIDGELNSISSQYEKIYKECDGYNLGYHTENILANINKLKELAEQYVKAKEQMEKLTINDIEL